MKKRRERMKINNEISYVDFTLYQTLIFLLMMQGPQSEIAFQLVDVECVWKNVHVPKTASLLQG